MPIEARGNAAALSPAAAIRSAALIAAAFWLVAVALGPLAAAQTPSGKRVALVIGNGAYERVPKLANPASDARAMSAALKSVGFQVVEAVDAGRTELFAALVTFAGQAKGAEAALVFYAGHGVQVSGENWLLPVDAAVAGTTELRADAVRLADVTTALDEAGARVKIVLLDACRDNPFPIASTRSAGQGLAPISTASAAGTLVAFATAPGAVAADGDGRNSPFTAALVEELTAPGVEIREMLGNVRSRVYAETGERQIPWVNEALIGKFYFAGAEPTVPGAPSDAEIGGDDSGLTDKEAFELAKEIGTPGAWNAYLQEFLNGRYAGFAEAAMNKTLSERAAVQSRPAAPPPPRPA
ncbi:MAG: caspase family protein, partial [Pseudomonadota bacterium]